MKIKFLLFIILLALGENIHAQQDLTFSLYNFNPLFANPATAGYQDKPWLSALGRYQWVGVEGAPRSAVISYQTPLKNENLAIGGLVKYDALGLMKNIGLDLSFAYRIKMNDDTRLSLGLMGSLFHYNDVRSSAITGVPDNTATNNVTAWIPNFGGGVYLFNHRYFVGISIPHLLNLKIQDPQAAAVGNALSRIYTHYFGSAGYVFGKEDGVKFKPTAFFKVSENSSSNIDINANLLLQERFWFGLGYRTGGDVINQDGVFQSLGAFRGESIVATFKMMATNVMELGYAYDYPVSNIGRLTSGSHEIYIGMEIGKRSAGLRYVSPRYVNYL
jgi:type IX secretion system PorP/SprF family membrane protein